MIADVKIALEDLLEDPERLAPAAISSPKRWIRAAVAASIVTSVLFAGFLLARIFGPRAGARWQHFTPFATESASESYPAWSPDGSALAYLAAVDGISQVFARGLDSPTAMQLTRSPVYCATPFWSRGGDRIYYATSGSLWSVGAAGGESRLALPDIRCAILTPDGKQFVFFRGPLGDRRLFLAPVAGGPAQPYRQAPFPETVVDGAFLAFSPDGSRLAAVVSRHSGTSGELWVLPWPSGAPRRALPTLPAAAYIRRFSWMPDNRRLVFDGEFPGLPDMHLYAGDTETGEIEPVTSGTGQERQPAVSPDGRRIAFASGSEDFDLLEIPLDGSAAKPLLVTSRKEEDPAWSPAGNQHAYVTDASGASELWLRSLSDGWSRPVLARRSEAPWPWFRAASPRISPDGQRIAYDVQGAQHAIWISTVGGGRPVTLDPETGDCHSPSWSPDGNWIAYRRLHNGKWELAKKPLGGGGAVRLAETMEGGAVGDGGMTDWSPAGAWIAHIRGDALYVVSPDGTAEKLLDRPKPDYFGFSKDGSRLYTIHRGRDRRWEAVAIDIRTGAKQTPIPLPIPPEARIHGFSVRSDDKSFAISAGENRFDIWILEDFEQPANWWTRLQNIRPARPQR